MGGQVGHTAWTVKFVIGAVGSCFLYKIRRLTATNLKQTLLRFCYLAFTVCLISCSLWSLFPTVERLGFKKAKSFQKKKTQINHACLDYSTSRQQFEFSNISKFKKE